MTLLHLQRPDFQVEQRPGSSGHCPQGCGEACLGDRRQCSAKQALRTWAGNLFRETLRTGNVGGHSASPCGPRTQPKTTRASSWRDGEAPGQGLAVHWSLRSSSYRGTGEVQLQGFEAKFI